MLKSLRLRRPRHDDGGSIAVMAAVIIPVILTVISLALTTLVWGASETEVQRASDQAAVQGAATALLAEFPYATVNTLTNNNNINALYPTLQGVTGQPLMTAPSLNPCTTLGDPLLGAVASTIPVVTTTTTYITQTILGVVTQVPVVTTTTAVQAVNNGLSTLDAATQGILSQLPTSCSGVVGSIAPIPAVPGVTVSTACDVAASNVTQAAAPYAINFYGSDDGQSQPTCTNTPAPRVRTAYATGSPLLGFGGTSVSTGDMLNLNVPSGFDTVQQTLAGMGVRLDSALPNVLCPELSVEVDQPVKGPIFAETSVPNGRSTARRVMKNAVVVPIFNGQRLSSDEALAAIGADGLSSRIPSTSRTTPAVNLNTLLLQKVQKLMLAELDKLDKAINAKLTAANARVQQLNGTYDRVNARSGNVLPGVDASVGNLDLLKCVRQTLADVFDPPSGAAATVDDVLKQAAADNEPVNLIQVGVTACQNALGTADAFSCVQLAPGTATGTAAATAGAVTGLYDVPIFDVTPTMVKDIGNNNFLAVPAHASQANGAFRASLVRSDSRYVP